MKKVVFIGFGLLAVLLVMGCAVYTQSYVVYFNDTGNAVENMRLCDQLSKENCDAKIGCIGYRADEVVCDGGKCYC